VERVTASAPIAALSDPEAQAIENSHLRSLSGRVLSDLTEGAVRLPVGPGTTIHWEGDTEPHVRLVVSGLVRMYVTGFDGRTVTVRYCRPGALIGVLTLFVSSFQLPVTIQAITEVKLLALRPAVVREAAERDAGVAYALLGELSERVLSFIAEIPGNVFTTVRQRLARHLLDLASAQQEGPELAAAISQQELAEAVGTVREVVVRSLRELRQDGVLATRRSRIVILDPERLLAEGHPSADRTSVSNWNKSH
jgi:CRP/FNR family cyclic AMP-dependent transcriptional regulator